MNELARPPLPHMTADEFLLWPGDGTRRRFHLIDGEVRAMAPASSAHGSIQSNLSYLLKAAARASGSRLSVATEIAVVPRPTSRDNVRVPDLIIVPGPAARGEIAMSEPVAVIEILSPGNAAVTWDNVRACATLASVREIVVVSSSRIQVDVHRRHEGTWPAEPDVVTAGGRLEVRTVGLLCSVEDVYEDTWLLDPSSPSHSSSR